MGYRDRDGSIYRLWAGSQYEVKQYGDMVLYSILEWSPSTSTERYYFSKSPNGAIYYLGRKELRVVFRDDPCLLETLEQIGYGRITGTLPDKRTYRIVAAYERCHPRHSDL